MSDLNCFKQTDGNVFIQTSGNRFQAKCMAFREKIRTQKRKPPPDANEITEEYYRKPYMGDSWAGLKDVT